MHFLESKLEQKIPAFQIQFFCFFFLKTGAQNVVILKIRLKTIFDAQNFRRLQFYFKFFMDAYFTFYLWLIYDI